MGAKFRPLSQKNGRCDAALKGRCTTPTHIYSICIGFRLIRLKPQDKFRREHWKKTLGISKMLWGPKFRHLSQTNGRTDIAPKGRCTTSTHIYSICIGFRLIRPKPSEEFRTKHWKKKSLGIVKCCPDLSSDASHRQTDGQTPIKNRRCTTSTHI